MADRVIKYRGEFDASGILASFKKIRDEAAKSGVGDKILAGYDKELAKVEKLTTQIIAQSNKGLTNPNDIKEYTRTVNQLEKAYGILNVKAQDFADANNYSKENAEVRKYANQLQNLIQKQEGLKKAAEGYIDANKNSLKISEKEANQLKKSIADAQAYKKVVDDIVETKMKAAQQKAAPLILQTQGGQQKIEEISNQQKNFGFSVAARKGSDKSKEALVGKDGAVKEAEALAAAQAEYNRILRETIQTGGSADDAMKDFTKSMKGYKLEVTNADEIQEEFRKDIEETTQAALANRQGLSRGDNQKLINAGKEMAGAQTLQNTVNSAPIAAVQQNSQEQVQAQESINKALEQRVAELEQIIKLQKQETDAANQSSDQVVSGLKAEGKEAEKNVKLQETIKGGFDRIGQGAKQILSVTTAWRSLRNVIKNTFNDVKALDKSFASIAMVTNYSVKEMWQQYDQYAEMANRLGQSTQSVVEASGLYYQQGLKTNEVLKLTEETMKLATLAGLDFKEATSQMTAALRAFHMDMSEGAHVTDVYAEVAAHAAVDVQGLSEAMSATAAIANSAGMSFEKTTAMLATMVEATQEAPKNLGTAMKTILARFTELKTNVAGTADSEFEDLDYNKVDKALKGVGVSIKDATGQFRNMDDVLLELSSKWNGLDRNSQRYIATIAAGSRQQSRFIALMENYERTMELVNVAQNSAGRSSQQFAKYQDTVEYKVNKLKNTWEQFRTNLLDSDTYKGALDAFGGFIDKINNKSTAGLLALGATWLTVGRKAIGGAINSWSSLSGNFLSGKFGTGGIANKLVNGAIDRNAKRNGDIDLSAEQLSKGIKREQKLNALLGDKDQMQQLGQDVGKVFTTGLTTAITSGLMIDNPVTAGLTAAGTSAVSLLPTFIDIGKKLGAGTGTAIGAAVTVAIGVISLGLSAWRKHLQEEENKQLSKQIENTKKQLESQSQLVEQLSADRKNTQNEKKDLEEIKQKYQELNAKIILNEDEQKEYNDLVDKLKENYPNLIAQYDAENNKIKLSNDLLDAKIEKLKTVEKEQKKAELTANMTKLSTSQRLEQLQTQDKYTKQIKEELKLDISSDKLRDDLVDGPESILNNSDVTDALKDNNDKLDKVKEIVSNFYKEYNIVNKRQKEEEYAEWKSKIRDLNPEDSDAANAFKAARAQKINSTSGIKELFEKSTMFHDFDQEQIAGMGFSFTGVDSEGQQINYGADYKKYKDIDKNSAVYEALQSLNIKSQKDLDEWKKNNSEEDQIKMLEEAMKVVNKQKAIEKIDPKEIQTFTREIENVQKNLSKESVDEVLKQAKELSDKYGETLISDQLNTKQFEDYVKLLEQYKLETSKTFKELDAETALQQGAILSNLTKKFGTVNQEEIGKNYEAFIKHIKGLGLSKELTNTLLKIDPTEIDKDDIWSAQDQIVKALTNPDLATHLGEDEAKAYAQGITSVLQDLNLSDFGIDNETTLESIKKKIEDKLTNIVKGYKSAMDKITSSLQDGFLDVLDKQDVEDAIKEIGLKPEDFIYTDNKGNFQVDVDKLTEATKEQLNDQEEIVKQAKAQAEQGLLQLKQKRDTIALLIKQAKGEGEILSIQKKQLENEAKIQSIKSGGTIKPGEILQKAGINLDEDKDAFEVSKKQIEEWEEELKGLDTDIKDWQKKIDNPETFKNLIGNTSALTNKVDQLKNAYDKQLEAQEKSLRDAEKNSKEAAEAVTKAYKSWQDAIEEVTKKQKALNEAIQGTEFWKASIDGMYNYTTSLDTIADKITDAKNALEDANNLMDTRKAAKDYMSGLSEKDATLAAERKVYEQSLKNRKQAMTSELEKAISSLPNSNKMKFNISDFMSEKDGRLNINLKALQDAKLPDKIKEYFIEQAKAYNDGLKKEREIDRERRQLRKDWENYQKNLLQQDIEVQQEMINVLKEKYQKEIDDLKEKYSAMEEADNKYLDSLEKAIEKQRKLRDEENSWNDLTNKERKLSLMRRDTSRGNAVETKALEKEVQQDREQLLDNAVDNMVDSLKEMYELQKESRDAEIEYRESLLNDTELLKEVTEALQNINSEEGFIQWMRDNNTEFQKMSKEQQELAIKNWQESYNKHIEYVGMSEQKFDEAMEQSANKVETIIQTTSETLTTEANRTLSQVTDEVKTAITEAEKALATAQENVKTQREAWEKAKEAAETAKKVFEELVNKLTEKGYVVKDTDGNEYKYDNLEQAQTWAARLASQGKLDGSIQEKNILTQSAIRPANSTIGATGGWGKSSNEQPKTSSSSYKGNKLMTFFIDDYRNEILTSTEYGKYMQENHGKDYKDYKQQEVIVPEDVKHGVLTYRNGFWNFLMKTDKKEDAESYVQKRSTESTFKGLAFKQGGLVDYTGPAWVDGSRSNPEAFLSSEDTRRIGEAARILADLPILSQPVNKDTITNNTVGDTNIQIEVNVDQIASDYDVDDAVKRVEEQIVKAAKYAGSNVILTKR